MTYVLEDGAVHAWVVHLDADLPPDHPARDCLSAAEWVRAGGIADATARHRFTVARGALRTVVAAYARTAPAALRLAVTRRGKPYLVDGPVEFSLTHAAGVAVIAVAHAAVGVDVERLGRRMDPLRLARRVLHPATVTLLEGLPADRLEVAFLDAWTQREAHAKALGGGLFHTPDTLPYVADDDGGDAVRHVTDRGGAPWSVARFTPAVATRAAVVIEGRARLLRVLDWDSLLELRGGT
jgi:4'-phosphopantetheinyl transferase